MALTVITFVVVMMFTTKICLFGLKLKEKLTHTIGMLTTTTIGTMSGLTVGIALGSLLKLDSFVSVSVAVVIGMVAGVIVGMPLSMVAILEGIMSGIMGGMMGAMLMSDHPLVISGFVLTLFLVVVLLLQRILKFETGHAESRRLASRTTLERY